MLTAKHDHQTVHAVTHRPEELRRWSDEKQLHCADCGERLLFKEYRDKQNHFSHFQSDCTFPFREPESIEHETGKRKIHEWLCRTFPDDRPTVEHRIEETNQRSDTFLPALRMAVEFQCSPIRAKTWRERRALYKQAGVKDLWILGYSMHRYGSDAHRFLHRLNELERAVLEEEGRLLYYDVLSHHFVVLSSEGEQRKGIWGSESLYKPEEVSIRDGLLHSKFDGFFRYQMKRHTALREKRKNANETERYIRHLKGEVESDQILATKKQINYIQLLLKKQNKQIPYKLHGLLKEEATHLISDLTKTEKNQP